MFTSCLNFMRSDDNLAPIRDQFLHENDLQAGNPDFPLYNGLILTVHMPANPESMDHAVDEGRYETIARARRVDNITVRNGPRGRSN